MESHSGVALAKSTVWYQNQNMLFLLGWGSVARFDMPPQSLYLSVVYSGNNLKVIEETGLNKGRINIAKLVNHHVVVGIH